MSDPLQDPAELRQQLIGEPQPLDDVPVSLTRYQAHRCAAIVGAFAAGHQGYRQAVRDVQDLLHACAAEAAGITTRPTSQVAWQRVDSWPWPQPGPPTAQPE